VTIAPSQHQRALCTGAHGDTWAREQVRFDRMLQPFSACMLDALALAPGDRVIDVGCGAGDTVLAIASRVGPAGAVLGIDVSAPLLALAYERLARAERRGPQPEIVTVCADAETHGFDPGAFDAVASRLGMTFFGDLHRALVNLRRALRSGGRLAFVCWQAPRANQWTRLPWDAVAVHVRLSEGPEPAGPGPFALADPARIRAALDAAGFRDVAVTSMAQPVPVGTDVEDATAFFGQHLLHPVLDALPAAAGRAILETLRRALEPHVTSHGVYLGAAAWLVSARVMVSRASMILA
jgi:SAM-dependent methyltransferase